MLNSTVGYETVTYLNIFFEETKFNIPTFDMNHFSGHKRKVWLTREPASTAHSISTDQKKLPGRGGFNRWAVTICFEGGSLFGLSRRCGPKQAPNRHLKIRGAGSLTFYYAPCSASKPPPNMKLVPSRVQWDPPVTFMQPVTPHRTPRQDLTRLINSNCNDRRTMLEQKITATDR
jgi:hypothetical protein